MPNGATISNFHNVIDQLKDFLPAYLEGRGIDTKHKFHCLSPQHQDNNPSCSLLPDKKRVYCHSCHRRFDLFDAVNILEGRPLTGPGFIYETLAPLAKQFDVPMEHREPTAEEVYQLDVHHAYGAVANLLKHSSSFEDPGVQDYIASHNWELPLLNELGIGCVDHAQVIEHLYATGFKPEFLKEIDIDRKDLFSTHHLIFTILDERNRAVGFAARNTHYQKGNSTESKYINTRTTGVRYDIYQRSKRLYGLSWALPNLTEQEPLFIYEGQPNVITSIKHGFKNCCAICGTGLTQDHLLLLKDLDIHEVVLCLDGDTAGEEATERLLDERFSLHRDMRVKVVSMPSGMDPDEFIRGRDVPAFRALTKWSAFEWRLQRYMAQPNLDAEQAARQMVPYITAEPSHIAQEKMCNDLAKWTGYSLKTIQSEVSRLQNVKDRRRQEEKDLILQKTFRDIQQSPEDAAVILLQAHGAVVGIDARYEEDVLSEAGCLQFLDSQKSAEESRDDKFAGFILGPDMKGLEEALQGEWSKDVLLACGGKANSGKTAMLLKLSWDIASNEEANNATVIYHTIDDTTEQLIPRWVCMAEGSKTGLTINDVRMPAYWAQHGHLGIKERRHVGYERLRGLMARGRLVIKDANDGDNLAFAEMAINYYKDKYPGRKLVYVLDNLHKLPDFKKLDERIRFKTISSTLKTMATRYHIAIMSTVEYTKLAPGIRPSNFNISETSQLDYDCNLIAHIHNELHDLPHTSQMFFTENIHGKQAKMPIIEFYIGKNKISDWKNRLFYYFYPASSDFSQVKEPIEQLVNVQSNSRSDAR